MSPCVHMCEGWKTTWGICSLFHCGVPGSDSSSPSQWQVPSQLPALPVLKDRPGYVSLCLLCVPYMVHLILTIHTCNREYLWDGKYGFSASSLWGHICPAVHTPKSRWVSPLHRVSGRRWPQKGYQGLQWNLKVRVTQLPLSGERV